MSRCREGAVKEGTAVKRATKGERSSVCLLEFTPEHFLVMRKRITHVMCFERSSVEDYLGGNAEIDFVPIWDEVF